MVKRRFSILLGSVLMVMTFANLLGLAVSYVGRFQIDIEGRGRKPDLSYDMGSDIWIGNGSIMVHSRNTDLIRVFEFEKTTLICALCLFLWSGIPGKWHPTPAAKPKETGLCKNCGYDLRASPERCPECGTMRMSK